MIRTHKAKVTANVSLTSLVGIHGRDYPLSYGNYFSMSIKREYQIPNLNESMVEEGMDLGFMVCNFNCENFREAIERFLSDGNVEITIFQVEDKYLFIAITDERIPEDWYHLWGEDRGYCNGHIHGKNYQEVSRTLGKRFGGDENYVSKYKDESPGLTIINVDTKEPRELKAKYTIEVSDNISCIEDNTPHMESTLLFKDLEGEE